MAKNAGFPEAPKRGNYKLRERLITKGRIYDMILQGKTYASIMQELGISERTFYRYLDIIFQQEQDFVNETVTPEELRRQFIIYRDRLIQQKQEIDDWLQKDPQCKDRGELADLRAALCSRVLGIYTNGPATFSSHHRYHAGEKEEEEVADDDDNDPFAERELTEEEKRFREWSRYASPTDGSYRWNKKKYMYEYVRPDGYVWHWNKEKQNYEFIKPEEEEAIEEEEK